MKTKSVCEILIIPELEEAHKSYLRELFITQDARGAAYLERLFLNYSYKCLQVTYNLTDTEKRVAYYTFHEHLMHQDIADKMGITYGELGEYHRLILEKTSMKKLVDVDMIMIRITYLMTSYIQTTLTQLVTNHG